MGFPIPRFTNDQTDAAIRSAISVYSTAQVDTLIEEIELTPGPAGPTGPTGAQGPAGNTGPAGPAGTSVAHKIPGSNPFTGPFGIGTNTAFVADRIVYCPLVVDFTETWTTIGLRIISGTGNLRLGIYSSVDGLPASLIVGTNSGSFNGAGDAEFAINQSLSPGVYWLALASSASATVQTRAMTFEAGPLPWSPNNTTNNTKYVIQYSYSFAALPSTPGALTALSADCPRIYLKK